MTVNSPISICRRYRTQRKNVLGFYRFLERFHFCLSSLILNHCRMILENASHSWNAKDDSGGHSHSHAPTTPHVQNQAKTVEPPATPVSEASFSRPIPLLMPQVQPGFIVTPMAHMSTHMSTHLPMAVHPIEPQAYAISAIGTHFGQPYAFPGQVAVGGAHTGHPHGHTCITNLNSSSWASNAINPERKSPVTLFMFEFACLFHSILIGMAVGISTDEGEIQALLIAILFHQALEGMSLGIMISESGISRWKAGSMMLAFSLTASIGIAIGMGLENSYSDNDSTRILVSGIFLGISGGLLLYVSLFQIVAEEFSKGSNQLNWGVKIGMYLSLISGAAAMCILAIWL
jgi:zinc transporter ZupT